MGRICTICNTFQESEAFTPFKNGKNGLYPHCKMCRKILSKQEWKTKDVKLKMLNRTRGRAKKRNIEFNLVLSDIPDIPEICPVLGISMETPSLDRIHPSLGYTKNNIRIISNRANVLKNNGTLKEFQAIIKDLIAIGDVKDG